MIGIMQGRLSSPESDRPQAFPWSAWEAELERARALGFEALEWLFVEEPPRVNPLSSLAGRERIREVAARAGVRVRSVCAHAFIDGRLTADAPEVRRAAREQLGALLEDAAALGAEVVALPLLELAALTTATARARATAALREVLPGPGSTRLALETDLPAGDVAALLREVDRPGVGACYDVGNATAFGFDAAQELAALGERVLEVHVKDRRRGGPSVALGTGDAPFPGVFASLRALAFDGPIVLETPARPDWEGQARANLAFVRGHL